MAVTNKHNVKVFEDAMKKVKTSLKPQFLKIGLETALDLVKEAVHAYDEEDTNLTGNLLNSIAGGVYINGTLEGIMTANKAADIPIQTHTYVRVGDGGFVEYRTGERVDYVRQYAGGKFLFQPVDKNKTGQQSALEFLGNYKSKPIAMEVIICAAAPYAEYLQNKRGLDVLTTAVQNAEEALKTNFKIFRIKL